MGSRRHRGKRHNKKQRGGDSASYGFGGAVASGAPYASEVVAKEGCVAATRPGTLVGYSAGSGGLPGFAGGGQRGGAWQNPFKAIYNGWKHAQGRRPDPGPLGRAFIKTYEKVRSYATARRSSGTMPRTARTEKRNSQPKSSNSGTRRVNFKVNNVKSGGKMSLNKMFKSFKKYLKSRRSKKQRGGRWTADVGAPLLPGPNQFVPVSRMACEGGMVDTSPPGAVSAVVNTRQMGGAGTLGSPYYSASTAGYGNEASKWVSSSGSPSLLQTPYEARTMNPACLKTGGGEDEDDENNNQDGGRRNKKSRRSSRRSNKNKRSRKTRRR